MAQSAAEPAVLVFARAPEPGRAKTRLIPLLGADGAARLHRTLLDHTLGTALSAAVGPVYLWCAPDARHPLLADYARRGDIVLASQCEGDLGARMHYAARQALAHHGGAILVGTDCPALTAAHLHESALALAQGCDAAFIPAEDGGYCLIALTRCHDQLFKGIAWGGDQVMIATRARLRELGWKWRELPPLWDVDRDEDYLRLIESNLVPELEPAGLLDRRNDIRSGAPERNLARIQASRKLI